MWAAYAGHREAVRLLIEAGADLNLADKVKAHQQIIPVRKLKRYPNILVHG